MGTSILSRQTISYIPICLNLNFIALLFALYQWVHRKSNTFRGKKPDKIKRKYKTQKRKQQKYKPENATENKKSFSKSVLSPKRKTPFHHAALVWPFGQTRLAAGTPHIGFHFLPLNNSIEATLHRNINSRSVAYIYSPAVPLLRAAGGGMSPPPEPPQSPVVAS